MANATNPVLICEGEAICFVIDSTDLALELHTPFLAEIRQLDFACEQLIDGDNIRTNFDNITGLEIGQRQRQVMLIFRFRAVLVLKSAIIKIRKELRLFNSKLDGER